ncbi:MAG: hypothetical protein ACOYKR_13680, partial [Sphingobacterium thalpophilum]
MCCQINIFSNYNLFNPMKVLKLSLPFLGLLMLALLVPSCRDDKNTVAPKLVKDYSSDVQLQWNQLFVDLDRYTPGYRPPAAARGREAERTSRSR